MTRTIKVVYEKGVLRPLEQLEGLSEKQVLTVTVETTDERDDIEDDPILGVIGICEGGPADGAAQHDHYIYGSPKR